MKKIVFILFLSISLFACSTKEERYSDSFFSFDTFIQIDAYASSEKDFNKIFNLGKSEFERYHQLFDAYKNYDGINNLKTINDNAGHKSVKVDPELYDILKNSKEMYLTTFQKNNITLAPVVEVYKQVMEDYDKGLEVKAPKIDVLKSKFKCVSMENIQLLDDYKVYLKDKCSRIDVGSVAKGYAANKVSEKLKQAGLKSGIVNAGGNVVVVGKKPNDEIYKIGIANPKNPESYRAIINKTDVNIVTSGDYQRYFMVGKERFNHIIDPDTLRPANIHRSVTIIMQDGFQADYLSTECFMLPKEKIDILAKKYKFEYIIIDMNNKVTMSDGIKDEVTIK